MPHEKVYGYCENLCNVEVSSKASVDQQISGINSDISGINSDISSLEYQVNNNCEKTINKTPIITDDADNVHYPTAYAVRSLVNLIENKLKIGADVVAQWKNTPDGSAQWYFYEGASTSTYDLPTGNCVVVVFKQSTSRGVAFAFGWAGGSTDKTVWKNTLHDSWKGWTSLHSN